MPRPATDLETYRIEIESLLLDLHYTYEQTVQELKIKGVEISERTLRRYYKD